MTIGTVDCVRMSWQICRPLRPGSIRSSSTRSGRVCWKTPTARLPSETKAGSYPSRRSRMPSISARAASSSTTRTRPRLGPFWGAVGGKGPILRCSGRKPRSPAGGMPPAGGPVGTFCTESPYVSVPVVVALERALDRDADIIGLHLGQFGEPDAKGVEVQPGDVLVQLLGQDGDAGVAALVHVAVAPQLDLGEHLVGER